MNDVEVRFEELRRFDEKLKESHDQATREDASIYVGVTRCNVEELVANQIYDKLTILFNNTRKRFDIPEGIPIEPIRNYDNFKLADDGELSHIYKRTVTDLGYVNERLKLPWEICELGVNKLKSMGFINVMDEDINPCKQKYKKSERKEA